MTQLHRQLRAQSAAVLFFVAVCAMHASAQGALKTIDNPGGGKVVYGQVEGQKTEAGAMGAVLRSLHGEFGERPQVSKLFQVRGTQSVAAFFSLTKHKQGTGQMAGLIIVTKATSDHVEVAVISDDAPRFSKTFNPMMKTLLGAWHPLDAARTAESGGSGASGEAGPPAAPLKQAQARDNSASVGLPDGWQLAPKMSMGGTIVAVGPHSETAELGVTFLAGDTNNPNVQRVMQQLRMGRLQNTIYAQATYYPYGVSPQKTFVDLMQMVRRKANLPAMAYHITSVTPGAQRCVRLNGTADPQDGKGPRELSAVYCMNPPRPATGTWMSTAYMTMVPIALAPQERATLAAIMQSFSVNTRVVSAEAAQMAAPAIAQIHAVGKAAAQQAAAAHERNDIQNSSVYQHWDDMDKRSAEFQNYQLGYTVVQDNQNNAHGTLWNEDADALVRQDPQRFEYVNAPNFWKGIDY